MARCRRVEYRLPTSRFKRAGAVVRLSIQRQSRARRFLGELVRAVQDVVSCARRAVSRISSRAGFECSPSTSTSERRDADSVSGRASAPDAVLFDPKGAVAASVRRERHADLLCRSTAPAPSVSRTWAIRQRRPSISEGDRSASVGAMTMNHPHSRLCALVLAGGRGSCRRRLRHRAAVAARPARRSGDDLRCGRVADRLHDALAGSARRVGWRLRRPERRVWLQVTVPVVVCQRSCCLGSRSPRPTRRRPTSIAMLMGTSVEVQAFGGDEPTRRAPSTKRSPRSPKSIG